MVFFYPIESRVKSPVIRIENLNRGSVVLISEESQKGKAKLKVGVTANNDNVPGACPNRLNS
jgi:hypothetical protein